VGEAWTHGWGAGGGAAITIAPVGSHEIHHLVREYGCLLVLAAVALQAFGPPCPEPPC